MSLGSFPGLRFEAAMDAASGDMHAVSDAGFLSLRHVQICPQNFGIFSEREAGDLMAKYPETQFRLHANVRVLPDRRIRDWAQWKEDRGYWDQLARVSRLLKAPAYTAHAGLAKNASLPDMLDYVREAEQQFGCPVGVEHHYPVASGEPYLLSSWDEMRMLLDSGVRYAIDLSHLMIVARAERQRNEALIRELLSSSNCIEVHLSWNDGRRDLHWNLPESAGIWWWPLLDSIHPDATIFLEGNLRRKHEISVSA